jgi:N-acyl-D-aspartate/D-glutamate deacylase
VDLVVFDPATVAGLATYRYPKREPAGMQWVIGNGRLLYDRGRQPAPGPAPGPGQLLRFRAP